MNSLDSTLQKIAELGVSRDAVSQYLALLNTWNKAYNLTAVRDVNEMLTRHILDSLAILPWIKGPRLIDVGTGAGLPGIPLALANPHLHVILLDSNGKKIRFLHEVKRVLSLTQVEIVQSRAEDYHPALCFDTVVSRAFTSLEQMTRWTRHLLNSQGQWLAMKGRYPAEELSAIHWPYRVETYRMAGDDSERCCVIMDQKIKE